MIKIHDKLWYIINEKGENNNLAYMTYYEDNSAFLNRKATGINWALRKYVSGDDLVDNKDGVIIDNKPNSNFKVSGLGTRWSTSNKLIRITDPRGFTVEIPTGNLVTLLQHTTIENGIIKEECIWGKENKNHILLSVNSEPYTETLEKMNLMENELLTAKDLTRGDFLKLVNSDGSDTYKFYDYYYDGYVKLTWKNTRTGEEVKDKWQHLFLQWYNDKDKDSIWFTTPAVPRIISVLKNEIMEIDYNKVGSYQIPTRVKNKFKEGTKHQEKSGHGYYGYHRDVSDEFKIVKVEHKDKR